VAIAFPAQIIAHAVCMFGGFRLGPGMAEDLQAARDDQIRATSSTHFFDPRSDRQPASFSRHGLSSADYRSLCSGPMKAWREIAEQRVVAKPATH
jgi:hypothetical protein